GPRSRARTIRSRSAAPTHQAPHGLGAVDDVAFVSLGQSTKRFGVCFHFSGFACGKVGLDGVYDRLMQAAMIFFGGEAQFVFELWREAQCHCHTNMVAKSTTLVPVQPALSAPSSRTACGGHRHQE